MQKSSPTIYRRVGEAKSGDSIGIAPYKYGDTVESVAHISGGGSDYYVYVHNNDTVLISGKDAMSDYDHGLSRQLTKFKLPKAKDAEAWSRAVYWVNKHSSMKIQTQSDYLIQTYNPVGQGVKFAYTVTKVVVGEEVEYNVECNTNNPFSYGDASKYARQLAFYMSTGRER